MEQLTGKVVVITGAKGGLGNFVTRAFLNEGATVAGVSRSIASADFDHPRFRGFPAELSSREAADRVIEIAAQEFGRVDAVVHLAHLRAASNSLHDRYLAEHYDLTDRAGLLEEGCGVGVIAGQHRPALVALLGLLEVRDPDPASGHLCAMRRCCGRCSAIVS